MAASGVAGAWLRVVLAPVDQGGCHAGCAGRVQLLHHVGEEQDLPGGYIQAAADAGVAVGVALAADLGVAPGREQRAQVAGVAMGEQQHLRGHRAGGIHRQGVAGLMPLAQLLHCVRIDRSGEVAVAVALGPEHALQRLERGVLEVLVDPPLQRFGDHAVLADAAQLGSHFVQPAADFRVLATHAHETRHFAARIGKQHVLDEGNAAGGAFDIGQDDAGHRISSARLRRRRSAGSAGRYRSR